MKLKITTLVIVEEGQTQELTSIGFKTAILDL